MNSKRRAELQRKLSMGAVPRPPADLSDRIKADIPQYLQTDVERARFSGSVAFSMRVAASILLLITTAFVTLRLLEPEHEQVASFTAKPVLVPAVTYRRAPAADAAPARPQPLGEEVRLDIAQDVPVPSTTPPASPRAAAAPQIAERDRRESKDDAARNENTFGFAPVTGEVADAVGERAEPVLVAEAPAPAALQMQMDEEARVAPPAAGAAALGRAEQSVDAAKKTRAASSVSESVTVTANAPSLVTSAYGSDLSLKQKSAVFGISVDPKVFLDMKTAIEDGQRPPASSVNVDALVNYFAGPPENAPRRITLEVEASPAPVAVEGDHAVLRFTIDTPRVAVGPRESTPPAATDAHIDIVIDPKAVASFHRIGGNGSVGPESMLLHNLSVTGLYDLELRPRLKSSQHVATITLRYHSVVDGKPKVLTHKVLGSDLSKDWSRASRRHRLASLGAVWSESLKGAAAARTDVARRAKELATQEPEDSRARELANAATATAGGKQ